VEVPDGELVRLARAGDPSPRHLIKSDELAAADPAQVIRLLRPCMLSLAASPRPPPL
jgi:hypothetical protein